MASIQVRKRTGCLIVDFYHKGVRCREQTAVLDTVANRKQVQKLIDRMESEIAAGTFDYQRFFPGSKNAEKFNTTDAPTETPTQVAKAVAGVTGQNTSGIAGTPLLRDFVETWFAEKEVEWRRSHKRVIRADLDSRIIPRWGDLEVGRITKTDILTYRAELAKDQARGKTTVLSNRRINKILNLLRQIVNEASDRYDFRTPFLNIKQLKVKRVDVDPFSLDEVKKIIDTIRPDFKNYYTVRFFTGMRTGEINGLKWKYVDFDRRLILIRETFVMGEDEYTKTDSSQREIQMSQAVYDALKAQEKVTLGKCDYVFCTRNGHVLDFKNVTNRVWYPILRHLGLTQRSPYQTRHTAATLWLASGESPQWIARQLGHSTTEMLFRVYSRFVPNLTRQDGSAFERLMLQSGTTQPSQTEVQTETQTKNKTEEISHE